MKLHTSSTCLEKPLFTRLLNITKISIFSRYTGFDTFDLNIAHRTHTEILQDPANSHVLQDPAESCTIHANYPFACKILLNPA